MQFNTSIEVMNVLYDENEEPVAKEGGDKEVLTEKNEEEDEEEEESSQNEEDEEQPEKKAKVGKKKKRNKVRRMQSMIGAGKDLEGIQEFSDFKQINTLTRVYIYALSAMRCFNLLSKGNKHIKTLKDKLDNGRKNLKEDFNLKNVLKHIRKQKDAAIMDNMKLLFSNCSHEEYLEAYSFSKKVYRDESVEDSENEKNNP